MQINFNLFIHAITLLTISMSVEVGDRMGDIEFVEFNQFPTLPMSLVVRDPLTAFVSGNLQFNENFSFYFANNDGSNVTSSSILPQLREVAAGSNLLIDPSVVENFATEFMANFTSGATQDDFSALLWYSAVSTQYVVDNVLTFNSTGITINFKNGQFTTINPGHILGHESDTQNAVNFFGFFMALVSPQANFNVSGGNAISSVTMDLSALNTQAVRIWPINVLLNGTTIPILAMLSLGLLLLGVVLFTFRDEAE